MGKFDDSFAIGDLLPTDDELELIEEESEHVELNRRGRGNRSAKTMVNNNNSNNNNTTEEASEAIVDEALAIHGRWVVVLVLCLSAAGMAFITFSYIARNERDEFEATVSHPSIKENNTEFPDSNFNLFGIGSIAGTTTCTIS